MAEHNMAILRDIEREISDIDEKMRGKTRAEQEKIIHDDRDIIMSIIKVMLREGIPLVGKTFIGEGVAYLTAKITTFLGYDPMAWLYFEEYDHNAKLADRVSSDPNLWNALSKACEVFEKNKGSSRPSRYLNKKSTTLEREISSIMDSSALADAIIAFCRVVSTGSEIINLDCNDVKIVLAGIIKAILKSADTKHKINENYASPILKPGCYGYVKYTFASDYHIQESCCSKYKFVKVTITVVSFVFPNEPSFRAALREMEV